MYKRHQQNIQSKSHLLNKLLKVIEWKNRHSRLEFQIRNDLNHFDGIEFYTTDSFRTWTLSKIRTQLGAGKMPTFKFEIRIGNGSSRLNFNCIEWCTYFYGRELRHLPPSFIPNSESGMVILLLYWIKYGFLERLTPFSSTYRGVCGSQSTLPIEILVSIACTSRAGSPTKEVELPM